MWIILFIIVGALLFAIYNEYKNEQDYKKEREKRVNSRNKKDIKNNFNTQNNKPETIKKDDKKTKESIELPLCNYPPFTHERLLDMGLSEDESVEFIKELITQINIQIPLIKDALEKRDFRLMERLTHSIKGSTINLGTGGISDLLVEYNTYLKNGSNIEIASSYFEFLKHYTKELEKQY